MTPTSRGELEEVKEAALAKGFEWAESQNWYEGHLEGEFIVARTDTGTLSDSMRVGPANVRLTHTVQVGDRQYVIGKDRAFGVLFARVGGRHEALD